MQRRGRCGGEDMCLITNIQRFSIHDGDGIRTTVFFKGCPLRCVWCHNPESQKKEKELLVSTAACTGCGACTAVCPEKAISVSDGKARTDRTRCTACGACTEVCAPGLREIAGRKYTVKELVEELLKDQMFYEESGGGVTFSGGEVLSVDMEFVLEAAKELKRQDISLAIDTCGYVPYERLRKILPYTDIFLYDLKGMDRGMHRRDTGADNDLVLENLIRLAQDGARICIRIPTVKERNGTEQNMEEIVSFLQEHEIQPVQINLIPYHDTGSGKYRRMDREYEGTGLHAPDRDEMEMLAAIFRNAGFKNTKIGG